MEYSCVGCGKKLVEEGHRKLGVCSEACEERYRAGTQKMVDHMRSKFREAMTDRASDLWDNDVNLSATGRGLDRMKVELDKSDKRWAEYRKMGWTSD